MQESRKTITSVLTRSTLGQSTAAWNRQETDKGGNVEKRVADLTAPLDVGVAKHRTYVVGFGYPLATDLNYDNRVLTRTTTVTEETVEKKQPAHPRVVEKSTTIVSGKGGDHKTTVRTFVYDDEAPHGRSWNNANSQGRDPLTYKRFDHFEEDRWLADSARAHNEFTPSTQAGYPKTSAYSISSHKTGTTRHY